MNFEAARLHIEEEQGKHVQRIDQNSNGNLPHESRESERAKAIEKKAAKYHIDISQLSPKEIKEVMIQLPSRKNGLTDDEVLDRKLKSYAIKEKYHLPENRKYELLGRILSRIDLDTESSPAVRQAAILRFLQKYGTTSSPFGLK